MRLSIGCWLAMIILTGMTTTSRAGDLRHAIETAEVIHSFDLGDATLTRAIPANGVFVLQFHTTDSSIIAAYTNLGTLQFWRSRPSSGRPELLLEDVSRDGSTVTLAQDLGYYDWLHMAVDAGGTKLCEFPVETAMQSSPTGRHFCPIPEDDPLFKVYDRSGQQVHVDAPVGGLWSATFVTDSLIGYVSHLHIRGRAFVHVPAKHPPDSSQSSAHEESQPIQTSSTVSPCKPIATVSHRNGIDAFALLEDGPHNWAVSGQIAFVSDCGEWIASIGDDLRDSSSYLHIASTEDRSVSAQTRYTGFFLRGVTCSWCQDVASLGEGVVSVLHSWAWGPWNPEYTRYETLFAEFDPDSMTISDPFAVHGIYIKARGETVPEDTYLRVLPPDTVQLVRLNR